jgi:hypothetical protein
MTIAANCPAAGQCLRYNYHCIFSLGIDVARHVALKPFVAYKNRPASEVLVRCAAPPCSAGMPSRCASRRAARRSLWCFVAAAASLQSHSGSSLAVAVSRVLRLLVIRLAPQPQPLSALWQAVVRVAQDVVTALHPRHVSYVSSTLEELNTSQQALFSIFMLTVSF